MKVLYSCLSQSWGGMEMFTITAINQLLKRNIETHLLCFPGSRIEEKAKENSIKTIPVKASGYFHLCKIRRLASLLKKENYDLIHTQASKDLWLLSPALLLANIDIPLFLTKQLGSFIVKKDFFHKLIYKRVTLAFAISSVIKKNLVETTPLTEEKIALLHNGVDSSLFNPDKYSPTSFRQEINIKSEEVLIGMIARFTPGKGHEEFLKAAEKLTQKFDNVKFVIVGEPSRGEESYAEKIKNLAKELNLQQTVIFTGYRADVPNVLAGMDIFVFPSHSEAFGIALVEAMSMKKAVVCSKADGSLDICVERKTGLFFEKGNHLDLSEKLETLIKDKALRTTLSENARKRVIEKFDIELLTDKVIGYYKQFVKK